MSDPAFTTAAMVHTLREVTSVLQEHRIECTGPEGVTCRGCRDLGWITSTDYRRHVARALADAGVLREQP